jgi:hypothetical protein
VRERLGRALRALGSFRLAFVLLLLLLLLTFLGTLEQRDRPLYDVQRDYFESLFLVRFVGGVVPLPLPGALLILSLLGLNLVVGGVVRIRKGASTAGVLVAHLGVLILLLGGLVEDRTSKKGHLTLYEGEEGHEFESWHEWEVAVVERLPGGRAREHVIPQEVFRRARGGTPARALAEGLPFEVLLDSFVRNASPEPGPGGTAALRALDPESVAERDAAGLRVVLVETGTGTRHTGILWALQRHPWQVEAAGRTWQVDLRKKRWPLPGMSLRLERFVYEMHPGTRMPRRFSSYVIQTEGAVVRRVHITMNEPLRSHGLVFFQSSYGPPDARPGDRMFSTFAVVENVADRIPIFACIVIFLGLAWHWGRKLALHLKAEARRRELALA